VLIALEKIKNDTYGVCDSCGQVIESERLDAMPNTSLCIECTQREEAKERSMLILSPSIS